MSLLLTILKFSGIIVSGALGILGTLTVTRDKETGRLTHWGKWALVLTISGFITALGSQIAQQVNEHHEMRDAQARIESEVALSKTTLDRVQRILTRFDTISFTVQYELPSTNVFFKALFSFVTKHLPPDLLKSKSFNETDPKSTAPERGVTQSPALSENITGFIVADNQIVLVNYIITNNSILIPFPSIKLLKNGSLGAQLTDGDAKTCFQFLKSPNIAVAIYARGHDVFAAPDLYLATTNLSESPTLGYDMGTKKLFISWSFSCPKTNWIQNKRMASLPDLADSLLYISPINIPPAISACMRPTSLKAEFDLAVVNACSFNRVNPPLFAPTQLAISISGKNPQMIFSNENPKGLFDSGRFKISWRELFCTQLPNQEQILNSQ